MDPVDDLTDVIGKILIPDISHRNLYKIAVSRHLQAYVSPAASGYRYAFLNYSCRLIKPPFALVCGQFYRLLDAKTG